MASIRYFSPAPALRDAVSSYYWFEFDLPVFSDMMRAELPQIRLLVEGAAANFYPDGSVTSGVSALLQGPTTGPVRFLAKGRLCVFGIGLLPLGWAELVGVPADALADQGIPLADVLGREADDLFDAVASAHDNAGRVAAANAFLLGWQARARAAPRWFTALADDWLTASAAPDVDALVAASGMSQRSVERLSKRLYGATPKLLARKYRALGAAVRLGNGEQQDWMQAGEGFYDQAHFIREFKQFTGMTPKRFLAEAAPVTRLTIARKRLMPGLPKLALYS
ncbi:MAG: helix-turn-helix domain-containing protein [Polymorphobacter sp.]|uniref:helix-turn-helix domain-containing protein n=1 Tax=Polymorphobacter sp. TaxID=1909290 RepID=UPI003A862E1F